MRVDEGGHPPFEVVVENIGGIGEASVECSPGVTVLTGRNATNRTSLLSAIKTALGSDQVALKGDADAGRVDLRLDGETYSRELSRRGDSVALGGEPLVEDPELAELFAFLLESNEVRRAVERGEDLHEVVMRPVDTADIEAEIDELKRERSDLQAQLDELDELEASLPDLLERRDRLEDELEARREELAARRAELDDLAGDDTPTGFEAHLEELREARRTLEDQRTRIEDQERVVEALEEDREAVASKLDGLAAFDRDELAEVERTVEAHRDAIQDLEAELGDLQTVIELNESLVDGGVPPVLRSVDDGDDGGSVTDRLVADDESLVCWTCGSEVERDAVERTLELLRELHAERVEERSRLREEVDELEAERKHLERTAEERRELRRRLEEVEDDLEARRASLEELREEADDLQATVAELEDETDALEAGDHEDRLALHRECNRLEFEIERSEERLDDLEAEIDAVEGRLDERDQIDDQIEELDGEIEALRSRIDRLEREAVEHFNEQMEAVLDLLEYDNLERVWVERTEREVASGRGTERRTTFDLHVVRATESGSVYEDTVDHLSESERQVVGLMFALTGYLVHEVHERVPFLLLDSLEAFDADRVARLVDHFAQFADYLVVALLPEDAAALDDEYQRVTEI